MRKSNLLKYGLIVGLFVAFPQAMITAIVMLLILAMAFSGIRAMIKAIYKVVCLSFGIALVISLFFASIYLVL